MSDATNRLVDGYYTTWGAGDFDGLAALLTDDFAFRGAMDSAEGPQAFIDLIRRNAPAFEGARFADVRRVVDGDRAVSLYRFELGPVSVPMAEAFEVRGDRIARVELYFDPARFAPPEAPSA
jgi:ketosteroid isomerase-like protein